MRTLLLVSIFLYGNTLFAQDASLSQPGSDFYQELPNPANTPVAEWSKVTSGINVSFASDNIRYPKERVPLVSSEDWNITAWKGEKVHTQILVWTKKEISELTFQTGDLVSGNGSRINSKNIKAWPFN